MKATTFATQCHNIRAINLRVTFLKFKSSLHGIEPLAFAPVSAFAVLYHHASKGLCLLPKTPTKVSDTPLSTPVSDCSSKSFRRCIWIPAARYVGLRVLLRQFLQAKIVRRRPAAPFEVHGKMPTTWRRCIPLAPAAPSSVAESVRVSMYPPYDVEPRLAVRPFDTRNLQGPVWKPRYVSPNLAARKLMALRVACPVRLRGVAKQLLPSVWFLDSFNTFGAVWQHSEVEPQPSVRVLQAVSRQTPVPVMTFVHVPEQIAFVRVNPHPGVRQLILPLVGISNRRSMRCASMLSLASLRYSARSASDMRDHHNLQSFSRSLRSCANSSGVVAAKGRTTDG